MVLNVDQRRIQHVPPALGLLLWCALAAALVQLLLWRVAPNPRNFSPIFWYLLNAYDSHGNLLLLAIAVMAFLLRRQPVVAGLVRFAAQHPWRIAAGALPLFCLGAATVYRGYPLSMDEYVALFQAETFAAGRLSGQFPPELMRELVPRFPPGYFFFSSLHTGQIAGSYWPGFALLMTPFAWLGIPWAVNPVISALTLPAVHRLTLALSGSREAAGWSVLLVLASPVFVVSALSFYAMPAHLLCNLLYVLLLLRPTPGRALLAGVAGSLALTLHNPLPHMLFGAAIFGWLLWRRTPLAVLAALVAGYIPLFALLGPGWLNYLAGVPVGAVAAKTADPAATQAAAAGPLSARVSSLASSGLTLPTPKILEARIAGLSKVWTWGPAALMVLAAYGYAALREHPGAKALLAALFVTFAGYFLVPFDQGHGWGYRYLHSAWFVLPVFAAVAMVRLPDAEMRQMAGWAVLLSLLLANGLRLTQVDAFIGRQLAQVPPLARAADPARREIVFVDPAAGFYTRDMVHNDPLLRGTRMVMVYDGREAAAALMARRFPAYTRREAGKWGELWTE